MKPISLRTLQIRIGKCHLNLKSDGIFGVSLQMGKNISSMSPKKNIQNNIVAFNTTLRMNIDKQLLEQQTHPKCRVLLHLIRENRQKQVIGVATIDIMNENNKGFKYHQFGQCADCEADIEMSITCSTAFQLGVRSQIGHYYTSESRLYEGNDNDHSRVKDSFIEDSMLDGSDFNLLNRSKAVSNVDWTSLNRPAKPSHLARPRRRSSNVKSLRLAKPQNLASCTSQQIITHYEKEIKTFEDHIHEKDEWANGMKQMIQQLEAENQLLKQIKIQELQQNNIQNLEQGIEFVSKLVHSKFQASKSMVYDTPISEQEQGQNTQRRDMQEEQLQMQLKQSIKESERSLTQTRSYKDLPQIIISPRIDCSPLKHSPYQGGMIMQSRQQLQNALKILTDGQRTEVATLQAVKIADLQESLFKFRQERQQLEDAAQELYEQLSITKQEKDEACQKLQQLQKQFDLTNVYIEQMEEDSHRMKEQINSYEKSPKNQHLENIVTQCDQLQDKNTELQRKLKESLKAIEEFKNDALNARSEIIVKEDQLNSYRMKFGELGSMTDVYLNSLKANSATETTAEKLVMQKDVQTKKNHNSIATTSTDSLHSLYSRLLENSVTERKQLNHSLTQIITEKTFLTPSVDSQINTKNLKKLQLLLNKLFIQIFKNNTQFKNLKQIETTKLQLTKQIQNIIASV